MYIEIGKGMVPQRKEKRGLLSGERRKIESRPNGTAGYIQDDLIKVLC